MHGISKSYDGVCIEMINKKFRNNEHLDKLHSSGSSNNFLELYIRNGNN